METLEDADAMVRTLVEYEQARILVDADKIRDLKDGEEALRHELFHLVLGPFEKFARLVERSVEGPMSAVLAEAWQIHCEEGVRNLEKIWDKP